MLDFSVGLSGGRPDMRKIAQFLAERAPESGDPADPNQGRAQRRPRLLDLFCCQGGAAMGYHNAGFEVIGVDIEPQPNYPFSFHQEDALTYCKAYLGAVRFDAIHASPPCQFGTKAQRIRGNDHANLIPATRELLIASGLPYVIENVEEVRPHLLDPVMLCGSMFGLRVYRHRLFETSFPLTAPWHPKHWLRQVKMGRPPAWG